MFSDDAHRHGLRATIEGLRYWVPSVADLAKVSQDDTQDGWNLRVEPVTRGACPFELRLDREGTYKLSLAGVSYSARPITSLTMFQPLIEAIIDGRVIQRHWLSLRTGATQAIETLVALSGGETWRDGEAPAEGLESRDRHFLPYRRSNGVRTSPRPSRHA